MSKRTYLVVDRNNAASTVAAHYFDIGENGVSFYEETENSERLVAHFAHPSNVVEAEAAR